ncbi:MAG: UrcA family protein [Gammaproteobacteria bacterium]|nr:MAG: UrcA family protein [Gammaproteobacteria bacterium]
MRASFYCVLLATLMGSTLAAATEMTADVRTRVVQFADLDLTRSAGVMVLYARIKSAAREVCEPINARALAASQAAHECLAESIARAVADVNAPALTGYHLAKTAQTITVAQRQ